MAKTILLEIITPHGVAFREEVEGFFLKAAAGEIGILPDHIPIVTPIEIGILKYKINDIDDYITTMGGFLEVNNNKAVILTEAAEKAADIDTFRAEQALKKVEASMKEHEFKIDTVNLEVSLKRAMTRLKAVEQLRELKRKK